MRKSELRKNINKGICILLAGTIIGSFAGCSKTKNEAVSINIIDNNFESNDEYTYIFDPKFIEDEALKVKFIDENIDLLRESKDTYYTSNIFMEGANITNLMTKGTFSSFFNYLVFPDGYSYVSPISSSVNTSLERRDFIGLNNDVYQYVEAKLEVKKDIIRSNSKALKKGDKMVSRALYVKKENKVYLLAYEQTGVGSDCENVKEKKCGSIDEVLINLGVIMDTDRDMTMSEVADFVDNYDNGTSKILKK